MNAYKHLKFLIIFLMLSGSLSCNRTEIKAYDKVRKAAEVLFTIRNVNVATYQENGEGELRINAPYTSTAQCIDCTDLPLNFSKVSEEGDNSFALSAKFLFPLVNKTYLCKRKIDLTYTENNSTKSYLYGIYICPENSRGQRQCDKDNAIEQCQF